MTEYDYNKVNGMLIGMLIGKEGLPSDHNLILMLMRILVEDYELADTNATLRALDDGYKAVTYDERNTRPARKS